MAMVHYAMMEVFTMRTNADRIQTDLEILAQCSATPGNGCTRLSFSYEYRKAADYLKGQMEKAGLQVREDPAGILYGRLEGRNPSAPVLMMGSHLDTIRQDTIYNGSVGIISALEVMRVFHEEGLTPNIPIEIAVFPEGEAARFGTGLYGSRIICGRLEEQELHSSLDENGLSLWNALESYGANPSRVKEAVRFSPPTIGRFLELHVEHGSSLLDSHSDIGIVNSIVGMHLIRVTIHGRADLGGTTPMNRRSDSFLAAARTALTVSDAAMSFMDGTIATFGHINVSPNLYNIVPGTTSFTVDIRGNSDRNRAKLIKVLKAVLDQQTRAGGMTYEITTALHSQAVRLQGSTQDVIHSCCDDLSLTSHLLPSGIYYDAGVLADYVDTALILLPNPAHPHAELWKKEPMSYLQPGAELLLEAARRFANVR